jgi:secreted trypsin-like serine protease
MVQDDNDQFTLVGVTSFGAEKCATKGWPGVYTNVAALVDWINQIISDASL